MKMDMNFKYEPNDILEPKFLHEINPIGYNEWIFFSSSGHVSHLVSVHIKVSAEFISLLYGLTFPF